MKVNPNKEKIKMFRKVDPNRTATSMAKELHITRERVRQLLNDLGLPTAFLKPQRVCDNESCNNKIDRDDGAKTCSRECFKAHRIGSFICAYCGKTTIIAKYLIKLQKRKYKNMYCTHSCASKAYWAKKKNKSPVKYF